MADPKSSAASRFWSKVDKSGECWVWIAGKSQSGYGKFGFQGKTMLAHRIAYAWEYGPVPESLCVCHRCDNPPCVRPSHLFTGTAADNIADRIKKLRSRGYSSLTDQQVIEARRAFGSGEATRRELADRYCVRIQAIRRVTIGGWVYLPTPASFGTSGRLGVCTGEYNNNAKLTAVQVQEIRDKYASGAYTQQQLWEGYGVSRAAVQRILHGQYWKAS